MSATPFFSDPWYRVAGLRLQLAPHVRLSRQFARGQATMALHDTASGRTHLLNESAWSVVSRCDGRHSLQAVWDAAVGEDGAQAPTQGETLRVIGPLCDAGVMTADTAPASAAAQRRQRERQIGRAKEALNPFAIRIKLLDPDAFLQRTQRWVAPLFTRTALVLWCVLLIAAVAVLAVQFDAVAAYAAQRLHTPSALLAAACAYPLVKLLHELGHGYALRRGGGEVHAAGVVWMMVLPLPYVDGGASAAFRHRSDRLLVAGIGMMVELALAAVGLLGWAVMENGLLRDLAFAVAVVGSVSTLLFNGNPLMRYDGYYLLSDALGWPNLAQRAQAQCAGLFQRHVLRLPDAGPAPVPWPEQIGLTAYGLASATYRALLSIGIVVWLTSVASLLGLAAGLYACVSMGLWPAWRAAQAVRRARTGRLRAMAIAIAGLSAVAFVIGVWPLPRTVAVDGVVWPLDDAQVRAPIDGFMAERRVDDGAPVQAGQVLFLLENTELEARRAGLLARWTDLDSQHQRALFSDPPKAQALAAQLQGAQTDLADLDHKLAQREVRAASAGRLVIPKAADLDGQFFEQGRALAYVVGDGALTVRVAIADADAALTRRPVRQASVWLADRPGQAHPAEWLRQTPSALQELPSAVLGDRAGGAIATLPSDPAGLRTLDRFFVADLRVPGVPMERLGGRVRVRLVLDEAPLAVQWGERLAQLFLRQTAGER
ncbi:MAG: hypothetical protein V4739_19620 [Pseudomonadota bacterium]